MRSIKQLGESLKRAGINAPIIELKGQCIGVPTRKLTANTIKTIGEYVGYTNIKRYEYEYSYGKIDGEIGAGLLVIFI